MTKLKALILVAALLSLAGFAGVSVAGTSMAAIFKAPARASAQTAVQPATATQAAAAQAAVSGRQVIAIPGAQPRPLPPAVSKFFTKSFRVLISGPPCGRSLLPPGVVGPDCAVP